MFLSDILSWYCFMMTDIFVKTKNCHNKKVFITTCILNLYDFVPIVIRVKRRLLANAGDQVSVIKGPLSSL